MKTTSSQIARQTRKDGTIVSLIVVNHDGVLAYYELGVRAPGGKWATEIFSSEFHAEKAWDEVSEFNASYVDAHGGVGLVKVSGRKVWREAGWSAHYAGTHSFDQSFRAANPGGVTIIFDNGRRYLAALQTPKN